MFCKSIISASLTLCILLITACCVNAQVSAAAFLLNAPDSRTGSMGEAGVALSSDANSLAINPSKIAFLENAYGFSLSYNPWLKSLVSDINLGYLSGYYKLSERNALGASIRYFSLGKVPMADAEQQDLGIYSPAEFAVDVSFARKYGQSLSLATSLRYIRSDMTSGVIEGTKIRAGTALAVDISAYYQHEAFLMGSEAIIGAGAYVSNIGTKLSYTDGTIPFFLPANLKIGTAITFLFDKDSQLNVALDLNKLLVPGRADSLIASNDTSVPGGIFYSFVDAPEGLQGEMKEISVGTGVEYWYRQQFALRSGYQYADPRSGRSSYLTIGAGFKYERIGFDLAYLMGNLEKSPMANSLKFTLLFNFTAN